MVFLGLTLYTTLILYVLFPNRQDLRVPVFSRDNLFTRLVAIIYSQDTNTNVCPSIHVIGSAAVAFAAWRCPRLRRRPVAVIAIWIFFRRGGGVNGVCQAALCPGYLCGHPPVCSCLPHCLPVHVPKSQSPANPGKILRNADETGNAVGKDDLFNVSRSLPLVFFRGTGYNVERKIDTEVIFHGGYH